jgi:hypothetical protein
MEHRDPTVIIGHDMSPELFVDVSTALQGMGVVVKTDGVTPEPGIRPRSSSWCRRRAAPARPLCPPTSPSPSPSATRPSGRRRPRRAVRRPRTRPVADAEHTLAQLARTSQIDATTVKLHLTPYHERSVRPRRRERSGGRRVDRPCPRVAGAATAGAEFRLRHRRHAGRARRAHARRLECATDVLLVSSLDVTSIRSLRKAVDALDHDRCHGGAPADPEPCRLQGRTRSVRRRGGRWG